MLNLCRPTYSYSNQLYNAIHSNNQVSSSTFSDDYLMDFFEKKICGDSDYAIKLVKQFDTDFELAKLCDNLPTDDSELLPFFSSKANQEAALKIVSYLCGTLVTSSEEDFNQRGYLKFNQPCEYFERAAQLGYIPALKPLSECYLRGEGLHFKFIESSYLAIEILNAASPFNTHGPDQTNNPEINAFLQSLFETKDPRATYQLAILNQELGNRDAAYQFLTIAVVENCPEAITKMGQLFFHGDNFFDIEKDEDHGEFLLAAAATEFHSAKAKTILEQDIYFQGKGKNAFAYLSQMQEKGNLFANMGLSILYQKGIGGVKQDLNEAHKLLVQASDAGLAEATIALAKLLINPLLKKEFSISPLEEFYETNLSQDCYSLLVKAADQNDMNAAFLVGHINLERLQENDGNAEEKSDIIMTAEKYLTLAKVRGHMFAILHLNELQNYKKMF